MRTQLLLAATLAAAAPVDAQDIIVRDVYEAIPRVEYQGGDANHPNKLYGVMKLTDTTLTIHTCHRRMCAPVNGEVEWDYRPLMTIDLRQLRELSTSAQVRGPGMVGRILWGLWALDRTEEFIGVVYESATSVEAPVFRVPKATSAAIEAKIRFRLEKLGVTLRPAVPT